MNSIVGVALQFYLHANLDGSQVWTSKEVSDDLLMTDVGDPDFATTPWLSDSMEFVYEDPNLPSILLYKNPARRFAEQCHKFGFPGLQIETNPANRQYEVEACVYSSYLENGTVGEIIFNYSAEDLNTFARGETVQGLANRTIDGSHFVPVNQDEQAMLASAVLLAFKVLVFSSCEGFAPRTTNENPTRRQGGKPGVNNRPKTRRHIVQYLPRQRQEAQKLNAEPTTKHTFLGRRGHMRLYSHDRYKEMRGKRVFIAPIPGPDGTVPSRKTFKVIKPNA